MLQKLKSVLKFLSSYLATPLPVGMTAYNTWLSSVLELAGPVADKDSMEWVISNEVMRLKSTQDRAPKSYFVKVLRKYAANQIAAAKVIEIKDKQQAAQAAKKAIEDSTAKVESDVKPS